MRTGKGAGAGIVIAALVMLLIVPAFASSAPSPRRVIVAFEGSEASSALNKIEGLGGVKVKDLPTINGAAMYLPSERAERAVERIAGVKYVEPDFVVTAIARKAPPTPPSEVLPWGVNRVDAELVWPTHTADNVKVAVIDTGIDTAHPDLAGNVKGGMSAVSYTRSYVDDNGHGTHVAGTIAAVDNSIGVVGVAPLADVYAVKVLNRQGNGYISDVIEGLQWASDNGIDVANMSLGTTAYSASLETAVRKAISSGVVIVAAAGNGGPGENTVEYPGRFEGVIAVAAVDGTDQVASFSARGPEVDLAAPGVGIYSTYKKSSYATMSGTSMATPHVAGVAALVLSSPLGSDDLDSDGVWDPAEVERRLERTTQDLGDNGFDQTFGNGLVQADAAVLQ